MKNNWNAREKEKEEPKENTIKVGENYEQTNEHNGNSSIAIGNKEEIRRNNGEEEEEQKQELMQLKTQVKLRKFLNMTIYPHLPYVNKENLNSRYYSNNNRMTTKKIDKNNCKKDFHIKILYLFHTLLYE